MRFAPDDQIGNYHVERELGSTSTGTLYQVVHVVLPRRAVLKVTALPPFAKLLLREACILEALRHPGAPQLYESGLLADRRPWFCAEQIDGVTLVERIVQGPMSAFETSLLVRDIAAVLEHTHRRGLVHRGLRPDRIVLTPHRRFPICIPDWSDARTHDAAHAIPHVPSPGSRQYVAPELVRGDVVDDRADIYALGVIAFLALTGKHPYTSPLTGRAPTAEIAPDAPPELCAIIDQMLADDRYDRPSAAEVRGDLDWLAAALSSDAAPVAPIEDIVLVDTDGVPAAPITEVPTLPRIRRPRWTPTYTAVTSDDDAVVAGEIEDVTSA
ncbi:MAG: serine/threonine protein kinase [Myxococcota bacterium]|nr:serine/threonine protein kinase [Myxococcota bacterium]